MSGKVRRTPDYLAHMLEAISRIADYVRDFDRGAFERDAVIRNLEIVGEAARNILNNDPAFAAAHPDIPWAVAYRMRNALSHGYADIDLTTVWSTVQQDLPELERKLSNLLGSK